MKYQKQMKIITSSPNSSSFNLIFERRFNIMKKTFFTVLIIVTLSAIVYAATLQWQRQVSTCTDTDGGLNFNVTGTASGVTLFGANYSFTDYCVNNNMLGEYACSTVNGTYLQFWHQGCNCVTGHCA